MYRVDLDIPFSDKDEAKQLGARWDSNWKVWYAPAGIGVLKFKKWIPTVEEGRVRAPYFFTLTTMTECWKCNEMTRVHAIGLPIGHEEYRVIEKVENLTLGTWVPQNIVSILSYVDNVSESVKTKIEAFSTDYKLAYSKQKQQWYLMNHCSRCGIKIGDHGLHGGTGKAFFFLNMNEALSINLRRHNLAFLGCGICGWWPVLDHFVNSLQVHTEILEKLKGHRNS